MSLTLKMYIINFIKQSLTTAKVFFHLIYYLRYKVDTVQQYFLNIQINVAVNKIYRKNYLKVPR